MVTTEPTAPAPRPTKVKPLTKKQAESLTKSIRSNVQELSALIKQAHDGKVWVSLGYTGFSEWFEKEFGWKHSRGFQLLNIAEVSDELCDAVALPDGFRLTDLQTRKIISLGRSGFIETFKTEAGSDPQENAKRLLDSLSEKSAKQQEAKKAAESKKTEPRAKAVPPSPADFRVSGGVRNSRTGVVLSRSVGYQARDFPDPTILSRETLEEGVALLARAKRDIQERFDELLKVSQDRSHNVSERMKAEAADEQAKADRVGQQVEALLEEMTAQGLSEAEKNDKLQALLNEEGVGYVSK